MTCDTCDHTVASINDVAAYRIFLCPRCGTVRTETYTGDPTNWHVQVYVPKLVERCRRFGDHIAGTELTAPWGTLGIRESIYLPDERG